MRFSSKHIIASVFALAVIVPLSLAYDLPVRIGDFVGEPNHSLIPVDGGFVLDGDLGHMGRLKFGIGCQNPSASFCFEPLAETEVVSSTAALRNESDYSIKRDGLSIHFTNDTAPSIQFEVGDYVPAGGPTIEQGDSSDSNNLEQNDALKSSIRVFTLKHEVGDWGSGNGFLSRLFRFNPSLFSMGVLQDTDQVIYESKDGRTADLYRYEEKASNRLLKNYTVYQWGDGTEEETYSFDNAVLHPKEDGSIEGYYLEEIDLSQNEQAAGADKNLLARASLVLANEHRNDLFENGGQNPDFIIPKPFVVDRDNQVLGTMMTEIVGDNHNRLRVSFNAAPDAYPLLLDPTLQFIAPGTSVQTGTIMGEGATSNFARSMLVANLDGDSDMDIAVGAEVFNSNVGRVYIFYNDGSYGATALSADVTITGQNSPTSYFGNALAAGDLDNDGDNDLAVGALRYPANGNGKVYIFWNDGSYPSSADSADVTIAGSSGDALGASIATGNLDGDSDIDLVVGASMYSSNTGRAYIFYQDGSWPATSASADVIITGQGTSNSFGTTVKTANLDGDSDTDLVVGASQYTTSTGRVYIFYNDGTVNFGTTTCSGTPALCSAVNADNIITGQATSNSFGSAIEVGDLDGDTDTDLAVGANGYSGNTGRVYVFWNDGAYPANANGAGTCTPDCADVMITGEAASNYFGQSIAIGNLDGDTDMDLAVGAYGNSNVGRTYLFYNDGTVNFGTVACSGTPAACLASNGDVLISGQLTNDYFGRSLAVGDLDGDTDTDLLVGAYGYSSTGFGTRGVGRAYIFKNDGSYPTTAATADIIVTGESTSNFGSSMAVGDFDGDLDTDLAVGAPGYDDLKGRVYLFYNDGALPTAVSTADVVISGSVVLGEFGATLVAGNFDGDSDTDLAVGAPTDASAIAGNVYIFYNDGSYPSTSATADVTIAGVASDQFGSALAAGNVGGDSKTDLVATAMGGAGNGRTYIFYNDGSWPVSTATADVTITGDASGYFGRSVAVADLDGDTDMDLAVGNDLYSGSTGRVYLFYQDGSWPAAATSADVTITGESGAFGISLASGNFDGDTDTDLAVGAYTYSSQTGRAYIFYNDGTWPTTAATADVIFNGEATTTYFGRSMAAVDYNLDSRTDLTVGSLYNANTGRVYIFSNDGAYPINASKADYQIDGESSDDYFGGLPSIVSGDLNKDGRSDLTIAAGTYDGGAGKVYVFYGLHTNSTTIVSDPVETYFGYRLVAGNFDGDSDTDLAVGAYTYNDFTGRVYLFYQDGSWPAQSRDADVTITGEYPRSNFGISLAVGRLESGADTDYDLAVGAEGYSSQGRVYIFNNDGSYPALAANADVIITGETPESRFGSSLAVGRLQANPDTTDDLAVGAPNYSTTVGRVYIFNNDGSYPAYASSADVTLAGSSSTNFGTSLATGSLNADAYDDLAVGAYQTSTQAGSAYIFYNDGAYPAGLSTADVSIAGSYSSSRFGDTMAIGDLDGDGDKDLVVGADMYSSSFGRAYIFYNDGTIPTTAATADVIITGQGVNNNFGRSIAIADFGGPDSKLDLAIGGLGYNGSNGRVYLFWNDGTVNFGTLACSGTPALCNASDGDVLITATSQWQFGYELAAGDFDGDSDMDLAAGAPIYYEVTSIGTYANNGRAFIYYNDGAYPTDASSADVIISGASPDEFGTSIAVGDLNSDGRADLAVGSLSYDVGYETNEGRIYVFYNDGSYPSAASSADLVIVGEGPNNSFGYSLAIGDLGGPSTQPDLVVGAPGYSSNVGRTYLFWNDGSIPSTASSADVIITGETSSLFGTSLAIGNVGGPSSANDLIAGGPGYSGNTGRAYLFYNDGTVNFGNATCSGTPALCNASNADSIFSGIDAWDYFGQSIAIGNLEQAPDTDNDIAVGAWGVGSQYQGSVYLFYNDGTWPSGASTADVSISGTGNNSYHGYTIAIAPLDSDTDSDLAVGAYGYNTEQGRVYLLWNDGAYPSAFTSADVIITGEASPGSQLGMTIATGDFDGDGDVDFASTGNGYNFDQGRVYIFYNDGSYPTAATSANEIITGQAFGSGVFDWGFGRGLASGILDSIGSTDIVVGANNLSTVYIYNNYFPFCGDGSIIGSEQCDDSNTASGDGCSSACQIESGYGCIGQPSACSLSGTVTTQGTISNTRPAFTVTPSDNGSSLSAPNNPSTTVTFTSTAKDVNGDQYYLAVCKTNYVKPGVDSMPQCCSDGTLTTCDINFPSTSSYTWAISDSDGGTVGYQATNSDSAATATYSVIGTEVQTNAWYAFNCDKLASGALCAPLNGDGNQGSALGQITFSGVPGEGTLLTIDGVVYGFDTNGDMFVSGADVLVDSSTALNGSQAASALVAVDVGPNSYIFSRANIAWVRADAIGAAGNSIAMAESGDVGNAIALSGANLTGGSDANASPFYVNHAPSLGTVKIGPQCDSTALIDPGNSRGATVTTDFASNFDNAVGAKIQSDGRILAVGRAYSGTTYDFALARYSADMILDASFGSGGKVTTPFGSSTDQAYGIVTQADGKIIAAGYATMTNADFALARYNTDGSLDTTFDTDGKVTTPVGSGGDYGYAVALQTDGKIVVAGQAFIASNDFAVARYNTDGSLDTTFDTDGMATTDFNLGSDTATAVAVQSDGKIVVAGYATMANQDIAVARYNTDGSLDTTFDTDGMVTTPVGVSTDYAYGIAIQSDGKIVVVGYDYNGSTFDFTLVRYTASGALDTTFDTDGIVSTPMGSGSANGISVAIQSDGDIIAAGQCIGSINNDFCLARYTSTGSLDTSFDTDGRVITDMSAGADAAGSVVLQPDGKIVAVGGATNATNDFAAARYNVDGSLNNLSGYACVQAGLNDADTAGTETVDLYVCSTNSFNGSACSATTLCNMNGVLAGSDAQCIIDNQVPIPTAHGSYNVYLFTKDSHGLQGSGTSTQTYSVTDVVPTLVSYTATDTPVLTAGGNDLVDFSAMVSDNNGDSDITAINGTFFDLNAVANTCTADHNNCYIDTVCDLDVASGTDTNRTGSCQVTTYFNANVSSNWEVHVNATDHNGPVTTFSDSDVNIAIPALAGVAVVETQIAYGTLYVGQTSSSGVPISVGNVGNQVIDLLIQGTDMTYSGFVIPRAQQKWNQTNGAAFDWDTQGHPLVATSGAGDADTNGCANVDLVVRDVANATTDNESLFWKLRLPSTQATGVYTGQATIAITSPTSCTGTP